MYTIPCLTNYASGPGRWPWMPCPTQSIPAIPMPWQSFGRYWRPKRNRMLTVTMHRSFKELLTGVCMLRQTESDWMMPALLT